MLNAQDTEWEEWYDRVESEISNAIKEIIENEKANMCSGLHQALSTDANKVA